MSLEIVTRLNSKMHCNIFTSFVSGVTKYITIRCASLYVDGDAMKENEIFNENRNALFF